MLQRWGVNFLIHLDHGSAPLRAELDSLEAAANATEGSCPLMSAKSRPTRNFGKIRRGEAAAAQKAEPAHSAAQRCPRLCATH